MLLSTQHLRMGERTRKLAERFCGPMKILQVISPWVYKLELPPTLKIHPVFHISKLRPFLQDQGRFTRPETLRPPPMVVQGSEEFEVERILDQRERRCGRGIRREFLVKWRGYEAHEHTWELREHLQNTAGKLQEFEDNSAQTLRSRRGGM